MYVRAFDPRGINSMAFQPYEEKEAERQLIIKFSNKFNGKVIKLQNDNDDKKTDGIVELNGIKYNVEARRKGYPNHNGKAYHFQDGWENKLLKKDGGIFINERTIRNYKNSSFIYIVDIEGANPRAAFINRSRVEELLKQPIRKQKSTNSGVKQSVKVVPLSWFECEV